MPRLMTSSLRLYTSGGVCHGRGQLYVHTVLTGEPLGEAIWLPTSLGEGVAEEHDHISDVGGHGERALGRGGRAI